MPALPAKDLTIFKLIYWSLYFFIIINLLKSDSRSERCADGPWFDPRSTRDFLLESLTLNCNTFIVYISHTRKPTETVTKNES